MKLVGYCVGILTGITTLTGCPTLPTSSVDSRVRSDGVTISRTVCARAIEYQDRAWKVAGLEIPVTRNSNGQPIKVGSLDLTPTKLREATEVIQALDILQESNCTAAQQFSDPKLKDEFLVKSTNQRAALVELLIKMRSGVEVDSALEKSKSALEKSK
jgi:hypothetical protein